MLLDMANSLPLFISCINPEIAYDNSYFKRREAPFFRKPPGKKIDLIFRTDSVRADGTATRKSMYLTSGPV